MLPLIFAGALALTGAAAVIYACLASDTNKAREDYNATKARVYASIHELRAQVEEVKRNIRNVYDPFKALMPLYVRSIQTADAAYRAKQDIRKTLASTSEAIRRTKHEMDQKYRYIKTMASPREKQGLHTELAQLKQLKQMLYDDFNNSKTEYKGFSERVEQFNRETHDLKEYIGRNCGEGGRIWYERKRSRR